MFWWILLGFLGLGMIWFIIEVITAPEMEESGLIQFDELGNVGLLVLEGQS